MSPVAEEKDVFRSSIEALGPARRGDDPAWLEALRRAARKRFDERPLPTTRDEAWRFTNVAPILRTAFRAPVEGPRSGAAECMLAGLRIADHRGPEIVFVNGRHAPEISTTGTNDGVEVLSLREALAREPHRVEPHLGRVSGTDQNVFADLNAAMADDGAVVLVAPGRRAIEPIHILFLATSPADARTASHPRTLIVTGRGSEATVVESYGGPPGESYLVNAVTEIVVEEGAGLHHVRLQREGVDGFHLATTAAVLRRDARLSSHSVSLGAALSRHDLRVLFSGPGAECVLNGLFVGRGTQHVDHHTWVDHAVPHGTSRELYKGILDERAHGVFDGKVLVRAGASKTDAQQANKNLLLSREALVDSMPALEILTDDVKCRHGSTTGQLDENALFYLRSRGLGEAQARSLLTYAFASDLVQKLPVPALRAGLERFLQTQLQKEAAA
jgi:Fe-S cluster assembly protein SufD